MKKLSVFNYIERAMQELEQQRDNYTKAASRISLYLEKALEDADEIVGVTYRVKTGSSLKEKIIRNGLYKKYAADKLVSSCTDIVGVRIECRFLEDEKKVYERLVRIFNTDRGQGYFCPEAKRNLFLLLDGTQPQSQKNGHEIYRIDGAVLLGGETYKFELQIKSLVNSFWSEIEHKIIYKNKRFMLIDDFVSELMSSINENLHNIDRQLNMLFRRCLDTSQTSQQHAIENMLTTLINELYSHIVERRAEVSVSIKPYSESLVKYILGYSSFAEGSDESEGGVPGGGNGTTVARLIEEMREVDFASIAIGEEITLRPVRYKTDLQRVIGEKFLANMNTDFFCNTFFHILFSIEIGNDSQDFMSYVRYYEGRIASGKSDEARQRVADAIAEADAGKMLLEEEILRLAEIE